MFGFKIMRLMEVDLLKTKIHHLEKIKEISKKGLGNSCWCGSHPLGRKKWCSACTSRVKIDELESKLVFLDLQYGPQKIELI